MSKKKFPYPAYIEEDSAVGMVYTPCTVLAEDNGQCYVQIERYAGTIWRSVERIWVPKWAKRSFRTNTQ